MPLSTRKFTDIRNTFAADLASLEDRVGSRWAAHHTSLPEHLYHYTTTAGFLGIIRSERVWATHTSFLNDKSEIEYGAQLMNEVLDATSPQDAEENELLGR